MNSQSPPGHHPSLRICPIPTPIQSHFDHDGGARGMRGSPTRRGEWQQLSPPAMPNACLHPASVSRLVTCASEMGRKWDGAVPYGTVPSHMGPPHSIGSPRQPPAVGTATCAFGLLLGERTAPKLVRLAGRDLEPDYRPMPAAALSEKSDASRMYRRTIVTLRWPV